jgi:PAS domain S-box-containing protein
MSDKLQFVAKLRQAKACRTSNRITIRNCFAAQLLLATLRLTPCHDSMASTNQMDQLGDGRFRLAFEHAPIGMALVGMDYRLHRVNAALCEALGYTREELSYRTFIDITHPDDVGRDKELADRLFRGEIPSYRLEKRFRTKDGQLAWLDLSAFVIRDEDGEPICGLAMVENITDRKRSEEALRLSEERYRSFIVNSSEAIWRFEIEQPIPTDLPVDAQIEALYKYSYLTECNDAMARLYGRDRAEEMIGSRLDQLISISNPANLASVRTFVTHGYRVHNTNANMTNPLVGERVFSSSVIGIVINNFLVRFWGVQRDETEKRKAADQIQHSQQQLRLLAAHLQTLREKERTTLAREMHDSMGNSLTSLKLDLTRIARRLSNPPDDQTRTEIVERLKSASDLLDQTIDQVKTISTELRPGVLDKFGLAAAIEWQCQEFERRTGITCTSDLPAAAQLFIPEHSIALFRILQEALTNIARHADARNVRVTLRLDGPDVALTIDDDGRGISTEEITAPNSLGLLGMRERMEILGGQFTITGQPGRTELNARVPFEPQLIKAR